MKTRPITPTYGPKISSFLDTRDEEDHNFVNSTPHLDTLHDGLPDPKLDPIVSNNIITNEFDYTYKEKREYNKEK